jgi:hypothetical protein
VARHLDGAEREAALAQALEAARRIGYGPDRAGALAALAPHLGPGLLPQALEAARGIGSEKGRAGALAALAPQIALLSRESLTPLWNATLHHLASRGRKALLDDLLTLSPVLVTMGGAPAVQETARAILDAGAWWP